MPPLKEFGNATSAFGFPTTEKLAKELDKLLESDPDYEYFKSFGNYNYFIEGEKADVSVITDDSIDEDGEVVDLKSLDLSRLNEAGPVAWNHNYNIPPLGKCLWAKLNGNKVLAKAVYNTEPPPGINLEKWFPAQVFHMIKSGYLPGKSIGGVAKKVKPTAEDIAANPNLKDVKFIRKNAKVFEYSVVPLRANKNAIVEAVSKGQLNTSPELAAEFPELDEVIKSLKPVVIGKCITAEDYKKSLEEQIAKKLESLGDEIFETIHARVLGRV